MRFLDNLILLTNFFVLNAQKIENGVSYRNMNSNAYVKLHYENDYFSTTDKYYTQGVSIEVASSKLNKIPLYKILYRSTGNNTKYGICLEHLGYTPSSIYQNEILFNDRPFAATVFIKTFAIVTDSIKKHRIVTTLSTGVIGPAAGGYEIQTYIHKAISGIIPKGWNNQIQNDIVLNYQCDYEKAIFGKSDNLYVSTKGGTKIGTLTDKFYVSTIFMAGIFDNPMLHINHQKHTYQFYIFAEPIVNYIVYDATLQGGLFNKTSPYTISRNKINHVVFQGNAGAVLKINKFTIEYFQTYISKEFKTGRTHLWGGLRLGCMF